MKKRYLVLQDGTVFEGYAFGADKESIGELIFTTGMVGYIETLTDPCYYGQIVMQTFPMVGNYGIIEEDKLTHEELMAEIQKGIDSAEYGKTYTTNEVLKESVSKNLSDENYSLD